MMSNHFFEGFRVTHSTPMMVFIAFSIGLKIITTVIPEEILSKYGFTLAH